MISGRLGDGVSTNGLRCSKSILCSNVLGRRFVFESCFYASVFELFTYPFVFVCMCVRLCVGVSL